MSFGAGNMEGDPFGVKGFTNLGGEIGVFGKDHYVCFLAPIPFAWVIR